MRCVRIEQPNGRYQTHVPYALAELSVRPATIRPLPPPDNHDPEDRTSD